MRRFRSRRMKLKLAPLLAAGVLFQGFQCALDAPTLSTLFAQSVASVFVSGWVNDVLHVSPFAF